MFPQRAHTVYKHPVSLTSVVFSVSSTSLCIMAKIELWVLLCVGLLLLAEKNWGFSLRVYPGYVPFVHSDRGQQGASETIPIQGNPLKRQLYLSKLTGAGLIPVRSSAVPFFPVQSVSYGAADGAVQRLASTGFKPTGYRRGAGPLDDCTSYTECRQKLISHFDKMVKMSNKG